MTYLRLFILLFIVHCSLFIDLYSQPLSTKSKKAERYFGDALGFYQVKDYQKAMKALDRAVSEDNQFTEALLLKADIYSEQQQIPEAIDYYRKAIGSNPEFSPNLYFILANNELNYGQYSEAKEHYLKYLVYPKQPEGKVNKANANLISCDFGIHAINNPVPFNPVNLGDSINTQYDEYINAVTADDQRLYFTRKIPRNRETINTFNDFEEDFFFSVKRDTVWGKAINLGPPINTHGNEGALCISPDGQYLFFAACNRPDGYGSCDIYWAKRIGSHWAEPENIGPIVNSEAWDSQPTFSSDGKTLYFASKRQGGKGSSDIWKSELKPDGEWAEPVNLGDSINTRGTEMSPFIHPDDQTLYFSSSGHPGMGGLDLYYSRRDESGNWKKPVNLGYPINTFADEITLVVNATGNLAYISSDKLGGKGKQDVYAFRLYKKAQPVMVTYMKGIVFDKDTKKKLEARFELIDLDSGKTVINSKSDPLTGEFLISLPSSKDYALNVSREGYLFYSDHFELKDESTKAKPFIKDIPLQAIRVGETVVLKNIFFDTDKSELKAASQAELAKLVTLLQANPKIRIEISGHTDNVGTAEYNITLSQKRAKAVYDWLISHGISSNRLSYAGYGLTKPISTNDTDQGRANNRRTEFRVVGE